MASQIQGSRLSNHYKLHTLDENTIRYDTFISSDVAHSEYVKQRKEKKTMKKNYETKT